MYNKSISSFLKDTEGDIYSQIDHSVDNSQRSGLQKWAWDNEISELKNSLAKFENGQIIFEYSIPRLGKRIDVVLLINNIIFVLEYKVGEDDSQRAQKQTLNYAMGLRWFHSASADHMIVPILVTTEGKSSRANLKFDIKNNMYNVIRANKHDLANVLDKIIQLYPSTPDTTWQADWAHGKYNPTPTIIEATRIRYINHDVKEIRQSEASAQQLTMTTDYLVSEIRKIKQNAEEHNNLHKAIFFVTGVPGAGKTLIGLDLVAETQKDFHSVFLSGNGPLVDVLTTALREDSKKYSKLVNNDNIEELNPDAMIQLVHRYRMNAVNKIGSINEHGEISLKPHLSDDAAEVEHVVVFDEAQRAWNRDKLVKPGRSGRKTMLQDPNFPYSEPAFLLWSLNLRKDWVAVVCLVGGGQEINTGEAGILEWIKAIRDHFDTWHIYLPNTLNESEYAGAELDKELSSIPASRITKSDKLHLTVSRRSLRAERVSDFVKNLLDGDVDKAKQLYNKFKDKYPIVLTRDVNIAKEWLLKHRGKHNGHTDKIGMLMSSKAFRLRPLGYEIKKVGEYGNVGKWFSNDDHDIESSDFLEVALSEFFVQGLELDWTGVMWDADFRDADGAYWEYYREFSRNKWGAYSIAPKDSTELTENQSYQKNAYRVLLTRARRGMVIIVPHGDKADPTRPGSNYDATYNYLRSIGLEEI